MCIMAKTNQKQMTAEDVVVAVIAKRRGTEVSKKTGKPLLGILAASIGLSDGLNARFPHVLAKSVTVVKGPSVKYPQGRTLTLRGAVALYHEMELAGRIAVVPCLGGPALYLPADKPQRSAKDGTALIDSVMA
jgi:hypothetical protein